MEGMDSILAVCQRSTQDFQLDDLLGVLVNYEVERELAQYIRANGREYPTRVVVERCLRALRCGSLPLRPSQQQQQPQGEGDGQQPGSAPGAASDDPDRQQEEQRWQQQRRDAVRGEVYRAVLALMAAGEGAAGAEGPGAGAGGGEESFVEQYLPALQEHLEDLNFEQLYHVLAAVCGAVEAGNARAALRLLELFPKAATLLLGREAPEDEAEEDAGPGGGGGRRVAAAASLSSKHVGSALHRLLHATWPPSCATAVMEALRGTPMPPSQLDDGVRLCLAACRRAELQALPGLLHQLLLLAGRGHKARILRGVVELFDSLERQHRAPDGRGPSLVLQQVEATALVTIATAVKYDSGLAQEWLKSLRASSSPPSPFCLLLLFALSRQHKLEGPVLGLVKRMVVAAFESDASRRGRAWASSLPAAAAAALQQPDGEQMQQALLRAVRSSGGGGGELLVPGIVALGCALLGSCPAGEALQLLRANERRLAGAEAEAEAARRGRKGQQGAEARAAGAAGAGSVPPEGSPGLRCALLGMQLLQAAFEAHPEARPAVLRLCQQALGGVAGAAAGGGGAGAGAAGVGGGGVGGGLGGSGGDALQAALPAVLLLGNLVVTQQHLLYDHTHMLKDALQHFLLLPAPAALGLLLALWPLATARRDLADQLVMTLRKVMFAREAASRLVAVRGFLFVLLQQLRVAAMAAAGGGAGCSDAELAAAAAAAAAAGPSFSQASGTQSSLSQMQALTSGAGVSLQHELQGFLRRALGQQAPVRAALYDGLASILVLDPGSREVVLELVGPQLQRYLHPDPAALPPLRLEPCTGSSTGACEAIVLLEPLPALLACVRRLAASCRQQQQQAEEEQAAAGMGMGLGDDGEGQEGAARRLPGVLLDGDGEGGGAGGAGPEVVELDLEAMEDEQAPAKDLVRCWDGLARRLLRCEAEHWALERAADLNPATAAGAARQLQASCLLGAVEVVIEELVEIATGPLGPSTARLTGERLARAFELHARVYELARDAKAAGSGGGRGAKKAASEATAAGSNGADGDADGGGGAADGAANGQPPTAKRGREVCPDLVPVEARPPAMSDTCLGALCAGVARDGLAADDGGGDGGAGPMEEDGGEGGGSSAHTRLARSAPFRAFVLRSCLNALAAAASPAALADEMVGGAQRRAARAAAREERRRLGQGGSAAAGLLGAAGQGLGDGAPEVAWRELARPLVVLCQTLLTTWAGPVKKPPAPRKGAGGAAGGAGGPAAAAAAAAARREAAAADSLAGLAVGCLRGVLEGAQAAGGAEAVAWVLRGLPIHSQDTQAQVDESELSPSELLAARLPHFGDMLARLMGAGSFREACSLVEALVGVAQLLPLEQQRAASDACLAALGQAEPRVTHRGLVRALVGAYVSLRGTNDVAALRTIAEHVQEVVGAAGQETQQEVSAPPALNLDTAQDAAGEVLRLAGAAADEVAAMLAAAVAGRTAQGLGAAAAGDAAAEEQAAAGAAAAPAAPPSAASARSFAALLEALCRRMAGVAGVVGVVVNTRLANPAVLRDQAAVVTRTYKLLSSLARAHHPAKGPAAPPPPPLSRPFQELVGFVHRELTPAVYTAIGDEVNANGGAGAGAGGGEGGEEGGAVRLSRAKLRQDAKAIPQLIFQMEEWDRVLVALGKARKVNLMVGAKRSQNRDFQIVPKKQQQQQAAY